MKRNSSLNSVIKITSCFLCAVIIFAAIVWQPLNATAENESKTVRIGWYHSAQFQEGMSDEAVKSGYSYEYIHKIADYSGWVYEYVYGEWSELFAMLESGEIDLLAGVSKTEERMSKFLYPNEIMGNEHYVLYQHSDDRSMDATDLSTFRGKKIGAIRNNLMTVYLENWLSDKNTEAEIVYYESFDERDRDFEARKLDAIVTTDNGILLSSGYSQIARVGKEAYYLTVTKTRTDLLTDLNRAQENIQDIDPYYLTNLEYQCYGTTLANSTLTAIEEEWLSGHSVLTVGYLNNYLPYSGTDQEGNAYGLITDVMDAIVRELNIGDRIWVAYRGFSDADEMSAAVKSGEIDAAFPVGGEKWQLEQEGIKATNDIVTSNVLLVHKGEYREEAIQRIAVTKGNRMMYDYLTIMYPNAETVEYPTTGDSLNAVLSGEADATTINGLRVDVVKKNRKYQGLNLKQLSKKSGRCIGVASGNTGLQMLLNRGIKLIGQDFAGNASYNYMSDLYRQTVTDFIADHIVLACIGVGLFIAVIVFAAVMDRRKSKRFLKIEEEKNSQLQKHQLRLEESAVEREAQIKEISTLNNELEERQAQLEESSAETEAHLEEIRTLNASLEEQLGIIRSMGKIYFSSYYIDLERNTFVELSSGETQHDAIGSNGDVRAAIRTVCEELVEPEFAAAMTEFMNMDTLEERMQGKRYISIQYIDRTAGWSQAYLIEGDRNENGVLRHLFFASRQIHEEKAIEEAQNRSLREAKTAADAANSAKTTFLFNMSHDIRTPMNAIMGFRDLLEKYQEDPVKRADYLRKIKDSSGVLLSIINNVLEMARIEKGSVEISESVWSAKQLNDTIISIFNELMAQKGISFTSSVKVVNQYVYCDITKLREVFINILSNACKYTNPGGTVRMDMEEIESDREGYALYRTTIKDTGIGMSEDFLPHIFEEFSRESNTTENKIEGTGLGMPIVKRLIELMDGTIEVRSRKGEGSTFIVTIPHRIAENGDYKEQTTVMPEPEMFEGRCLLLAEDNDLNAEIAMEILNEAGFAVERAENGNVCYEKLCAAPAKYYDAILMDIQMPVLNGYEATVRIRQMEDPAKAGIPIIAMTANAFEEDKRKAFRCGMNGHVAKPIDVQALLKELAGVLA